MSCDPMLEGTQAMDNSISTMKASRDLKTIQNAEQNPSRTVCILPRDMRPYREPFDSLGFKFEDTGDDVMFKATLPEGWTIESNVSYGGNWTYLIDEKGRIRGKHYLKGAHMFLYTRFRATFMPIEPGNWGGPIKVFAQDADNKVIFEAGQCNEAYSPEYDALMKQVKDFLDSNYPDWEDETKYWD